MSVLSNAKKITANIEGLGNSEVYISYINLKKFSPPKSDAFMDTIQAVNNKFEYSYKNDVDMLIFIAFKNGAYPRARGRFYFPREKSINLVKYAGTDIHVTGYLHSLYLDYQAKGGAINEAFTQHRISYIDKLAQSVKINLEIENMVTTQVKKLLDIKKQKKTM
jgi:hypothetical protein